MKSERVKNKMASAIRLFPLLQRAMRPCKAVNAKFFGPTQDAILSMTRSFSCLLLLALSLLIVLASCSTTANLPEDEVLYTGISEISYGRKAMSKAERKAAKKDSTGVITSLYAAYNAVDDILSGRDDARSALERLRKQGKLTKLQEDSLIKEIDFYDEVKGEAREEVNAALAYAPNNSVFGSSSLRWPLPIGLWFYNSFVNSKTAVGKWMFNSFAATPRTINSANPQLRVQVARNTLRNFGFFRGKVDYEVFPNPRNPRKAKIAYSVYPNQLFRLGTIEYQRFNAATDSLIRARADECLLHTGDAFSVLNLDSERKRLSTLFRNNGFYYFRPEYIGYRADTLQTPQTVQLQVRPKPDMPVQAKNRFYMGKTSITVFPYDNYDITDSLTFRDGNTMHWSGGTKKPPLRYGPIKHNLFYRRGSLYRQSLHDLIQQKLSGMGIFSNIQISYAPRDTSATCDSLDVNIFAVLDKPWDSEFEAKVTNKSNGLLGPGLSYGMTKRNAFRGAESVNFKVYGNYEWQTGVSITEADKSILNSYELGAQLTLTYPRIQFFGLNFVRELNRRALSSTNYKLDIDWMNRSGYFQMVSFGGRLTYSYQRRRYIKHELTPLRLDYDMLIQRSARFDSILNSNQALYVSMRNQLVPSIGYNFTYSRTFRNGHVRTFILGGKEAGHVVNTIYVLAGRPLKERDKHLLGVPFAQFLKLTGEWREYYPVTQHSGFATRLFLGAVWSYWNSTMAPYNDLFNIGGANSIRAFAVRTIGPGSYHPANSSWSYVDQVGNLKLEANVEYRFPLVSSLYGALFIDAGNVWLMVPDRDRPGSAIDAKRFGNDLALGTGFGFRYDLDFLVLRFDIGIGIHAPYDTGKKGYYNMPRFKDSLGFHIAVGYPF